MFGTVVLSLAFLTTTSLIASDNVSYYLMRLFHCVVLGPVTIPSYNIGEVVTFNDVSDYPIDGVLVFVWVTVTSLTGCTVFGTIKLWLC